MWCNTGKVEAKFEFELGDIYISFFHRLISFDRQHLNITYKLCASVRLEVTGISQGTLLPLTLKTSLNINLVNIFGPTLNAGSSLFALVCL